MYSITSAAIVAAQMGFTFGAIQFGLMVGIGGGVPCDAADIRLGDIVGADIALCEISSGLVLLLIVLIAVKIS